MTTTENKGTEPRLTDVEFKALLIAWIEGGDVQFHNKEECDAYDNLIRNEAIVRGFEDYFDAHKALCR